MEVAVFPWQRHAKLLGGNVVSLLLATGRNGCGGCAVHAAEAYGEVVDSSYDGASDFVCGVSGLLDLKKLCGKGHGTEDYREYNSQQRLVLFILHCVVSFPEVRLVGNGETPSQP